MSQPPKPTFIEAYEVRNWWLEFELACLLYISLSVPDIATVPDIVVQWWYKFYMRLRNTLIRFHVIMLLRIDFDDNGCAFYKLQLLDSRGQLFFIVLLCHCTVLLYGLWFNTFMNIAAMYIVCICCTIFIFIFDIV